MRADGRTEEGLHANNGMKTVHPIAVVDVARCPTLLGAFAASVVCLLEYPTIFHF
jgi:hypothetical protein